MWQNFFSFIFDQLFPLACLGCNKEDLLFCDDCLAKIHINGQWRQLDDLHYWTAMDYHQASLPRLIETWKYLANQEILPLITSKILLPEINDLRGIIPVPLHKRRELERGFNQSLQWADYLSKHYHVPVLNELKRIRMTKAQAQLSSEERKENVADAFVWKGEKLDGTYLLVDDVFTTGSTMLACKKPLQEAGAEVIGLALARGGQQKTPS